MRRSPGPQPRRVRLTTSEAKHLRRTVRRHSRPHREVLRAKIILQLDANPCVALAAKRLDVDPAVIRKWRDRFLDEGRSQALRDKPRSGHPTTIGPVPRCEVIAMACAKPKDFGVECRNRWTSAVLTRTFNEHHPDDDAISRSSVVRILNDADIKPHRTKMWLHSPDPHFREKVTEICELYLNQPKNSVVLCVDEKTGMRALGRKHPNRGPAPGRSERMDYEYVRNGTRTLIASFNVHSGWSYGEVGETRKADDLVDFMESVAEIYSEGQVHIVWDNLNIHHDGPSKRWTAFNARHGGRFHFHYTPIHASWVDQVELFFGILHGRVLRHGVFDNAEEMADSVIRFIDHWNEHEAHPFRWTFTGYPLQIGDEAT